jgi:hypothetical protein
MSAALSPLWQEVSPEVRGSKFLNPLFLGVLCVLGGGWIF